MKNTPQSGFHIAGSIISMEIHEKRPNGFTALVEVAACYIEIEGKVLLLQQGASKPEAGAWGVPAGKLEKHETPQAAARRELFEETSIQIEIPSQIQSLGCLYIRQPKLDYTFHLFQIHIPTIPPISISHEHQSYGWFPIQDLHSLVLRSGAKAALDYYFKYA